MPRPEHKSGLPGQDRPESVLPTDPAPNQPPGPAPTSAPAATPTHPHLRPHCHPHQPPSGPPTTTPSPPLGHRYHHIPPAPQST